MDENNDSDEMSELLYGDLTAPSLNGDDGNKLNGFGHLYSDACHTESNGGSVEQMIHETLTNNDGSGDHIHNTLMPNGHVDSLINGNNAVDKEEKTDDADIKEQTAPKPVRYYTKRLLKYQTPVGSIGPLPEGWIMFPHTCGLPIYFHKESKVVTWSRPYTVTAEMGRVKKHDVPVASIPCLEYHRTRQKIEKELKKKSCHPQGLVNGSTEHESKAAEQDFKSTELFSSQNEPSPGSPVPKAILHNANDIYLGEEELISYLDKRFLFDTTTVPHFEKWADKRKFTRKQRQEAAENFENNKSNVTKQLGPAKMITLTIPREGVSDRPQKVVFNTSVKPMVCILHEYTQSVLRSKVQYVFTTKDDSSEPFEAKIVINDKTYGTAQGVNKKAAKNKAALETMEMLAPGFKKQVEENSGESSVEYFNDVPVTDPRIYELCLHAGNYLPHQLLSECLKRNQGLADTAMQFEVQVGKAKMVEYKMVCGKHTVTGSAKNKKISKQLAAQQILQLLHPKVTSWGEMIKMYGTSVAEKRARKKNIEQEIFELKQRRSAPESNGDVTSHEEMTSATKNKDPTVANPELLSKLRQMMQQLSEKRKSKEETKEESGGAKRSKLHLIDV
ncbi:microprocessor complex subunit DGCR8-like isoform X2 [Clavelina lepadiformis]|uniref:microprocessor complex subunit DGCR8-like isoform X2 n=1 Tax=Clavelina lepadiformis TaxID=159417 RepID=UPI00404377A6